MMEAKLNLRGCELGLRVRGRIDVCQRHIGKVLV